MYVTECITTTNIIGMCSKSLTVEDVFTIYRRHKQDVYCDCSNWFCVHECCLVVDIPIGDLSIPISLNRRGYIVPGQECPVCFEAISTKKNAYLLPCGHGFHRTCMLEITRHAGYCKPISCPLCRRRTWAIVQDTKYNLWNKKINRFDEIECLNDIREPIQCQNGYDHIYTTRKTCVLCNTSTLTLPPLSDCDNA